MPCGREIAACSQPSIKLPKSARLAGKSAQPGENPPKYTHVHHIRAPGKMQGAVFAQLGGPDIIGGKKVHHRDTARPMAATKNLKNLTQRRKARQEQYSS